jgi:hypothetical protein
VSRGRVVFIGSRTFFSIFFISPLLSLTGFSLGMNIFHFEAFSCPHENLGSKQLIFTYLGSLERSWPVDGSYHIFDHELGLCPAPDPKESLKILKMDNDGALSGSID